MGEDADRITIEQGHGDAGWVSSMPGLLRGMARRWDSRSERNRGQRMVRAVESLYPALCRVEMEILKGEGASAGADEGTEANGADDGADGAAPRAEPRTPLLNALPFRGAVNDDRAIERGLEMFDVAWRSGAIALRASNGKLIPPGRGKVIVPACGQSIDQVKSYFVDRAARIILRQVPKVYERVAPELTDLTILPRLRRIGGMKPAVVNEVVRGFDGNVRRALIEVDDSVLDPLVRMRPRVLRALRESLAKDFPSLLEMDPSFLEAIATAFTIPEQVHDLGKSLLLVQSPDALHALAGWDRHDITEKVNEDRERRGLQPLTEPVYTTDIRALRAILGNEFDHLMEFPAALLEVFGRAIRETRELDVAPRQARIDQMMMFCQRYMDYLNRESVAALFLMAPEDQARIPKNLRPTIAEVFFILEGLWGKPGFGRKFFENIVPTQDCAKALRMMMLDHISLKERGSIKGEEELAQIVANSDLLDNHIKKFMNTKAS